MNDTPQNPYHQLVDRYLPSVSFMPLATFVWVFLFVPLYYGAEKGFWFVLLTVLFVVGLQPHIKKLSQEDNRLHFAISWKQWTFLGKTIFPSFHCEWNPRFFLRSEKLANTIVSIIALIMVAAVMPLLIYLILQQADIFLTRIEENQAEIKKGLEGLLTHLRDIFGKTVPEGNASDVIVNLLTQAVGDIKKVVLILSKSALSVVKVAGKDWLLMFISAILLGSIVGNWDKEVKALRSKVQNAITYEPLRYNTIRLMELLQVALSTLIVGFIEVAFTLAFVYAVLMILVPFNIGLGAVLLISFILGFITAVWKVGGIVAKIVGPLLIILNLQAGIGYFGWEIISFGLWIDVLIKAFLLFAIAFLCGALEAYNFTPEKVGARLNLTKMEMVSTVLIFALGGAHMGGLSGLVKGVLALLIYQSFSALYKESKERKGEPVSFLVTREDIGSYGEVRALELAMARNGVMQSNPETAPVFQRSKTS